MSQKLKTLKEKLRQAIRKELVEYDNLNTRKEKELEERINLFVETSSSTISMISFFRLFNACDIF